MTKQPKLPKTFTRSSFAEHNFNYVNPSRTNQPLRKNNNHVYSHYWDNPITTTNSVNFQNNPHPPQDHSENYPFFQQNRNKKQTPYLPIIYHLTMMIIFNQIFLHHIHRNIAHKDRDNLNHLKMENVSAKPNRYSKSTTLHMPNSNNAQSFQPLQPQNPMTRHSYQPNQMQHEIQLPYYLQQHEITKNQLTNFSQTPNAAESLQMTMNPYLVGGSSIISHKPLMVFKGTDPEYSVEGYLNAVTANLILNIGPEPINTPLHQNSIHRRTALIQTTLDGAVQKWFSVLLIDIKSDWKCLILKETNNIIEFYAMKFADYQTKQLAFRIETLVRKAYSLNTHNYKNTKMTEILMMTLTPQLRKIAIKKRASHPSSIREPDLDFRKLVDKLEQAEITMKLEETENVKLQYVNHIETKTTHINNIQELDVDLSEKITEILNIYERNPNWKGKPSFKNWCNYCRRYGHSISECRQKQQDNQNNRPKHKEPNKSFYQYMKKDQNLPNKNVSSNNSSGKPLPSNQNYSRNQSPYNSSYRGRSPEQRNSRNFSQNRYSRSNSRNNYPRSNSNSTQFVSASSSQSNRNRHYSNNQSRNSSYNRNRNYSNNRNRSCSNNRNRNYSNNLNNSYPNNRSRNNSYNSLSNKLSNKLYNKLSKIKRQSPKQIKK